MAQKKARPISHVAKTTKKRRFNLVIVGIGIVVVALVGILILRYSRASNESFTQRYPETGNPYVVVSLNLDGTVSITKSTNGETRIAPSTDAATKLAKQMYDEMKAAPVVAAKPTIPTPAAPQKSIPPETAPTAGTVTPATSTTSPSNQQTTDQTVTSVVDKITTQTTTENTRSDQQQTLTTIDLTANNLTQSEINQISAKVDAIKSDQLSTLSGTTLLKPGIASSKAVVMVGYYLNKKLHYYSSTAPFSYDFDTTRVDNGVYRLDVVGFDANGNQVAHLLQKFNIENNVSFLDKLRNFITAPWYTLLGK